MTDATLTQNSLSRTSIQDRVPFSDMRAFSALFTTYCTDFERVADFYAGDWQDPAARRAAAERAAEHARDRDTLVDVL
ncbi:MAG TPA: hypothetical protein VKP65_20495, partial [Rhodothermales bacterium]|nr:hypothetical protein [Rhodothermales bacterium]